jgi:hypothetical protein
MRKVKIEKPEPHNFVKGGDATRGESGSDTVVKLCIGFGIDKKKCHSSVAFYRKFKPRD